MSDERDDTRAKHAEELRYFLDSIVDNVPIMLFVKDAEELRFKLWNKAGEELLGQPREKLLGRSDRDFFPPDEVEGFIAKDREVLDGKKLVAVEEKISTSRGLRHLYTKKIPVCDEAGVPRYLLGISEDITDRKEAARLLTVAKEAAEAANQAKSDFLANVSHELRTPLTLILSPLDALLAGDELTPKVRQELERMRRNAGRLARQVNDLLDFAKLEAGKSEPEIAATAVVPLVEAVIDDALAAAEVRGISLALVRADALGEAPVDPRMFEKIVMNLVGNALKFTPRGGRVEVSLADLGAELELSVRDTGIGIAADEMSGLFQRFQQVDASSTRRQEGTGLGLSLVKELASAMGGSVGASSEEGKGSRFWVRLPRDLAKVDLLRRRGAVSRAGASRGAFDVSSSEPAPASPEASVDKPRLVVAEDNADLRAHLVELLSNEYEVEGVGDGRAALAAARERLPDAILSDVMMPDMDGLALVRAVKADPILGQVPIVLLTARASPDQAAAGLDLGADDYVPKPFSPAELRARLRAAVRLHRAAVELALTVDELKASRDELIAAGKLDVSALLPPSEVGRA